MYKILTLLFFLTSTIAFAQDATSYILSKEQHDLLRKNIEDYKVLIVKFNQMNQDFEVLKKEYSLSKALKNNDNFELQKLQQELLKERTINSNHQIQYDNLKNGYNDLQHQILSLNKQLETTARQSEHWRRKYSRQLKYDRGDRIMEGTVFGLIVGSALMAIYITYEDHFLHHN